jgi:cellulose 1,4-beta-cellobiosidase
MVSWIIFGGLLLLGAQAQQPGTNTAEVHPLLQTQKCTLNGGCKPANTSIVLDSNFRWLHNVGGYSNCFDDQAKAFNQSICTDADSCVKNCAVEGADYPGYGLATSGNSVTMNLFVKKNGALSKATPRIYLYDEEAAKYANFSLLNQEFAFDVDTSKSGCGVNTALYLSEMSITGDQDRLNTAGAKYGTGYCDAQCPKNNFLKGRANLAGKGACCNEMDIWEANREAMTFTPHPCNITGVFACSEPDCGNAAGADRLRSVCDKEGCDFNPYRLSQPSFYGRGKKVDSTRPFTVVTQFITTDGTAKGDLKEIRRLYIQDGKHIQEATAAVKGLDPVNSMTDQYCSAQKKVFGGPNAPDAFRTQGGMKNMGEALRRGMVLAFAIWDDASGGMHWLDSTVPENATSGTPGAARGPCPTTGGFPAQIMTDNPDAAVIFSKIRSGDIGSTYT